MKALVAGIGNIFFGDDGYGSEVARALDREVMPADVRVADFGIRGMHVAFEMLDGYDLVLLVDAVSRGGAPGTLYAIEPENDPFSTAPADAHAMDLQSVLVMYERLSDDLKPAKLPKIVIIGCEPESTREGIGLSDAVAAAVPSSLALIYDILVRDGIGDRNYEKA